MGIIWFNEDQKTLITTIYDNNITLNKSCVNLIENAYSVMLGLDYDQKVIHIKPLTKDVATRGDISEKSQYKITIRSSYARVCNISFINEIKKIIGSIDLKQSPQKFIATFDEQNKSFLIDLNKEYVNG
ncbi:MAG: hypothetical protein R3Y05_00410 [bacterium]